MPRFQSLEDHQRFLETFTSDELLSQCIERLSPILTHKKKPSTMRVPIDFEHDDDAYVLERLREVRRRGAPLTPECPPKEIVKDGAADGDRHTS